MFLAGTALRMQRQKEDGRDQGQEQGVGRQVQVELGERVEGDGDEGPHPPQTYPHAKRIVASPPAADADAHEPEESYAQDEEARPARFGEELRPVVVGVVHQELYVALLVAGEYEF